MYRLTPLMATSATLLVLALEAGCPQRSTETWILPLAGPDRGALMGAIVDGTAILAVGATRHMHMAPYLGDVLMVRTDVQGELVWERTWGGEGYEQAWSIAQAAEGEFFVFGETDSYGAGDRDFFLLRIDAQGNEIWKRTYGTPLREWPFGMLPLADGDLLLYGRTQGEETNTEDQYAVRVSSQGEIVWEYNVPSRQNEIILDALETDVGDLVLCVSRGEDPMLVKLTATGGVVWQKHHELPGWQFGSSIAAAANGELLLTGFKMVTAGSRHADVWIARMTAEGDLISETSIGRPGEDDYAHSLLRLSDGTYLVGGLGRGLPLFKLDEDGSLLWERRLDDNAVYVAGEPVEMEGGEVIVPAMRQLVPGRSYDALLVKVDREGRLGIPGTGYP